MIQIDLIAQTTVNIYPIKDNTLYESSTGSLSNGSGQYLFVGRTNQPANRRAVLKFDVGTVIPAGATITNASFSMTMDLTISGASNISLHILTQDWGEGASIASGNEGSGGVALVNDATWIHTFQPGTFWSNAGGDFLASASATTSVNANGVYSWASPQVISNVQSWLSTPATNFGWLIKGDESTFPTSKRFGSRDNTTASIRPVLTITYTLPCTLPTITSLASTSDSICSGDSSNIIVSGNLNDATAWFLYKNTCGSSILSSNTTGIFKVIPDSTTTYFVRGEGGCVVPGACNSITINVSPMAQITTSGPTTFCQGDSLSLFSNTGSGLFYQWLKDGFPIAGANSVNYNAAQSGFYKVIITSSNPTCVDTSQMGVTVIVNPLPNASITASSVTTFCQGGTVTLNGFDTSGVGYQWTRNGAIIVGSTTSSFIASQSGIYKLVASVISSGCIDSSQTGIEVLVNPLPFISLGNDTVICHHTTITLNPGTGFASYLWSNSSTFSSLQIDSMSFFVGTHTIWVKVTDSMGCVNWDTVRVTLDNCLGINENLSGNIKLFPNPFFDNLQIDFGKDLSIIRMRIIGSDGKLVLINEFFDVSMISLNTELWSKGIYFIEIITSVESTNFKIIKL